MGSENGQERLCRNLALRYLKTLYTELFEIVKLNLLFLVTSLGIVTLPAACCGMGRVTWSMVQEEDYKLGKLYWSTFKAEFLRSFCAGVILFPSLTIFGAASFLYYRLLSDQSILYFPFVLSCMVFAGLFMTSISLFLMIPLVDLPVHKLFKNAFLLLFLRPRSYLAAFFVIVPMTVLTVLCVPYSAPILLLLWFAAMQLLATFCVFENIQIHMIGHRDDE